MITKKNKETPIKKTLKPKHKKNFFKSLKKLFPNLKSEALEIIQVTSDTMHPTVREDSYAVIDLTQKDIIEDIHAIDFNGFVKIRRLQFNMDGTVTIFSDNKKSLNSYDEIVTKEHLQPSILGRVVHIIN